MTTLTRSRQANRPGIVAAATVTAIGGLAFGVRLTPAPAGATSITEIGIPLARLAAALLGIATTGLALYPILHGRTDTVRRAGSHTAIGWMLAALCMLWLQSAEISSRGLSVRLTETLDYASHISTGRALTGVVVAAAGCALLGGVPAARLAAALAGLVAVPLTGHATQAAPSGLGGLTIALHVIAAALWVGGLAAVLLLAAAHPDALGGALPRFSALAGICILTVAASGVILTILRLAPDGLLHTLTGTGYGLVVLAKVGCLCVLAGTGGYIRQRLLPRIVRGEATAFAAWAGTELAVMTLAVALATALSRAPLT